MFNKLWLLLLLSLFTSTTHSFCGRFSFFKQPQLCLGKWKIHFPSGMMKSLFPWHTLNMLWKRKDKAKWETIIAYSIRRENVWNLNMLYYWQNNVDKLWSNVTFDKCSFIHEYCTIIAIIYYSCFLRNRTGFPTPTVFNKSYLTLCLENITDVFKIFGNY